MDITEIRSRVKRMWKRRLDPMTRCLIRAYLDERKGKPSGISGLASAVSRFYKPALSDYVIYPTVLHYLKLMTMDLEFDRLYGSRV